MKIAQNKLNRNAYFLDPTQDIETLKDKHSVDMFDQNGYHLTKAEQAFLTSNGYESVIRRDEDCLRYDWLV